MLTLSDGTILTPGRIGRAAEVVDFTEYHWPQGECDDARAREMVRFARVQELKMYARLASVIYEIVETEVREQLRKRQLAANPRKDDR